MVSSNGGGWYLLFCPVKIIHIHPKNNCPRFSNCLSFTPCLIPFSSFLFLQAHVTVLALAAALVAATVTLATWAQTAPHAIAQQATLPIPSTRVQMMMGQPVPSVITVPCVPLRPTRFVVEGVIVISMIRTMSLRLLMMVLLPSMPLPCHSH